MQIYFEINRNGAKLCEDEKHKKISEIFRNISEYCTKYTETFLKGYDFEVRWIISQYMAGICGNVSGYLTEISGNVTTNFSHIADSLFGVTFPIFVLQCW